MPAAPLRVAVGVLLNRRGEVLVSRRHAHLHQGGLWEFPGGKVHEGETVREALARELDEELGVCVEDAEPLVEIEHRYPDRHVRLEVWWVTAWSGEPRGLEGQPVEWRGVPALDPDDFPAANRPIIDAIRRGPHATAPEAR